MTWCTCVVHCLTGLHRFLRLSPFDDITVWKKMIGSKGTPTLGHLVCITSLKTHPQTDIAIKLWRDCIKTVVAALVLQRTKEELSMAGVSVRP